VKNESSLTRFAYAISRRVGKAVVRNKVRRRLREILRALPIREGYDIVITARPDAATSTFDALRSELTTLITRARLIEPRE
jgi:ribonuclease P protein component